ncbi:MAG: hypothetical protein Q8M16_11655, partial [Pirellulaceae bacterium]|nr:hypothetical protein [Pirellulaceae bacterium]
TLDYSSLGIPTFTAALSAAALELDNANSRWLTAWPESIWRVPTWHQKTEPTAKLTAARVLPFGERRPRENVPSSPLDY